MCKNVRYANVYDPDDDWQELTEYTHMLCYSMLAYGTISLFYVLCFMRY